MIILRDGARHGYDIAREVTRRTNGLLSFKHANMYLILYDLEREELIKSSWEARDGGRMKRVYSLTERGLAACELRLRNWDRFTEAMQRLISPQTHEQSS